jgi:hypothetical protein
MLPILIPVLGKNGVGISWNKKLRSSRHGTVPVGDNNMK